MWPLKQSTALDLLFFAHDANGDAVTGLADAGFTKSISKNGAAFAAMTVTITERAGGWYHMQLSSTHTDTLGVLTVYLTHASCKQVNLQWRVHARLPDDLAYPATSGRSLQVEADGMVHADAKEWAGAATATDDLALKATLAKGTDITGFTDLDAAGVRSAVGLAAANLDTQLAAIDDFIDTEVGAIKTQTDKLTFDGSNRLSANVKAVNDAALTGNGQVATPWGPA